MTDRGLGGMSSLFSVVTVASALTVAAWDWDWSALFKPSETAASAAVATAPLDDPGLLGAPPRGPASPAELGAPAGLDAPARIPGASPTQLAEASAPGLLCGDRRLEGVRLGRLSEPLQGDESGRTCGAKSAIRLDKAAGVTITPTANTNCRVAKSLADWIEDGVNPAALTTLGAKLVRIRQIADYSCRTRNRQEGAPLSEHARANALDIASFTVSTGGRVSVEEDWLVGATAGRKALFLQQVWRAACGPFTTVLGPLADAYHQNHFHLDAAARNRPYCR